MSLTPGHSPAAALKGVPILLMNAQTVDETLGTVIVPGVGIKNHTFSIKVSAAVTGALQLETASDPTYAGVWSPLGGGPIDLATVSGELELQFSNIMIVAARPRISTVVAGGNVSVVYTGQ